DACTSPVPAPPARRMQAPDVLSPPLAKMLGNEALDFMHQPGTRNSHRPIRFNKPSQVVQVQIVRPVIEEGIDAHDSVEELRGERQRSGVCMDRKHAVLDAGITDALDVLRRAEPEVGCPNLDTELAAQKNRRRTQ